jgi:sialate O-acetylesterase
MNVMSVTEGLRDFQVLQRGRNGLAVASVVGWCRASGGAVEARVLGKGKREVMGWTRCGRADGKAWSASLKGVPVGGPYDIHFRAGEETAVVRDVLVGDLWVLAGQSNMEGCGSLAGTLERPHPLVHSFGMDEDWARAQEPLHWLNESIDACHNGQWEEMAKRIAQGLPAPARRPWRANRPKGAGCGLSFAKEMVKLTGVPVGLLPCAHGGTSMAQWNPGLADQGGKSQYGSMLRRVKACGGSVAGVLWYQGESDAAHSTIPDFVRANVKLVQAMRRDFANPRLPFLYAQIGYFANEGAGSGWNMIQQLQIDLEAKLAPAVMVAVIDLPMDDFIHIGADAQIRLGQRFATVARRVALGDKTVQTGPRPAAVWAARTNPDGLIHVKFAGVNGRLSAPGRPAGFALLDPNGAARSDLFRITLDGDTATLQCGWPVLPGTQLVYGRGLAPYCNITDAADLPVPVFGPVAIGSDPKSGRIDQ